MELGFEVPGSYNVERFAKVRVLRVDDASGSRLAKDIAAALRSR